MQRDLLIANVTLGEGGGGGGGGPVHCRMSSSAKTLNKFSIIISRYYCSAVQLPHPRSVDRLVNRLHSIDWTQ